MFREALRRDLTEFVDPDDSVYQVFFELLPLCRDAHEREDREALRGIYGFAEWCIRHPDQDLWNPAGVAFYEHLVDDVRTRNAILQWVPADVFAEIEGLLERRMDQTEFAQLKAAYVSVGR